MPLKSGPFSPPPLPLPDRPGISYLGMTIVPNDGEIIQQSPWRRGIHREMRNYSKAHTIPFFPCSKTFQSSLWLNKWNQKSLWWLSTCSKSWPLAIFLALFLISLYPLGLTSHPEGIICDTQTHSAHFSLVPQLSMLFSFPLGEQQGINATTFLMKL